MARRRDYVQRTLADLRADGWTAEVVEKPSSRYCATCGAPKRNREDLLGIADIFAIKYRLLKFVQVAGPGERLAHMRKIEDSDHLAAVRRANIRIELWTWSKIKVVKKDGKKGRAERWRPVIDDLS